MEILNIKLTEIEVKRLLFVLRNLSKDNAVVSDYAEISTDPEIGLNYLDLMDNLKNLIDVFEIQLSKED